MHSVFTQHTFTLVDVETTGGSPYGNRVIEIGIMRVAKGRVQKVLGTLINPEVPIPRFITGITGITDHHVAHAPRFADIMADVQKLFKDAIFVAHNVNFDYHFIRAEFLRHESDLSMPRLCTVRLSRTLYPEHKRHGLSALIERFNFECEARHRALGDAKVLWDFLQLIQRDFSPEQLAAVIPRLVN